MGVLVIYKQASEHRRDVESFMVDFERQTHLFLETIDPESRSGADICRLYDVVEYPTLVAVAGDGQMRNMWRGLPLPTIDEVSYYVR